MHTDKEPSFVNFFYWSENRLNIYNAGLKCRSSINYIHISWIFHFKAYGLKWPGVNLISYFYSHTTYALGSINIPLQWLCLLIKYFSKLWQKPLSYHKPPYLIGLLPEAYWAFKWCEALAYPNASESVYNVDELLENIFATLPKLVWLLFVNLIIVLLYNVLQWVSQAEFLLKPIMLLCYWT